MRASLHLCRRFLGHLGLLLVLAAAALAGLAGLLDRHGALPSPWTALAPLALLAAAWTSVRTERLGERVALAQTGVSPLVLALPCAGATLLVQAVLCLPVGGLAARPAGERAPVLTGVGGDLLLRQPAGDVLWPAGGAPRRLAPRPSGGGAGPLPPGFTPEPPSRPRLRRQLFVARSPFHPADHPLDPTLGRWLWAVWSGLSVLLVLGVGRRRGGLGAIVPFALVVLWL